MAAAPLSATLPPAISTIYGGLVIAAAVCLLAWRTRGTCGFPLVRAIPHARGRKSVGPWELALLVLVLAIGVLYVGVGLTAEGTLTGDSAYYYGVARHMVRTGRFEEPIVWNFLSPPDAITHAPFDYWSCLTSLTLVPVMWLFGPTHQVALMTMAVVSGVSLIVFWYLVAVVAPPRHAVVQLLALLCFALSPGMVALRFDVESIPFFHILFTAALVTFARRKHVWTVVLGFLLVLTRSEGVVHCLLLWVACAVRAAGEPADVRKRRFSAALIAMVVTASAYCVYHLYVFGTPTPPAARMAPFIDSLDGLLEYDSIPDGSMMRFAQRLVDREFLYVRAKVALDALVSVDFMPAQNLWYAFALVPGLGVFRRRPDLESFVWIVLFGGTIALSFGANEVFSGRTPTTLLPVVILAGAYGLDEILARLGSARRSARHPFVMTFVIAICVYGVCHVYFSGLHTYEDRQKGDTRLAHIERLPDDEVVASDLAYWVIGYADSPAVTLPINGEAAIEAVLRRYRVRWMLVSQHPWPQVIWRDAPNADLLRQIYAGQRRHVGRFRLNRVPVRVRGVALFRVEGGDGDR